MSGSRQPYALTREEVSRADPAMRPVCPSCSRRCPRRGELDCAGSGWGDPYNHRCPHGAPCPAFGKPAGDRCADCARRNPYLVIEDDQIDVTLVCVPDALDAEGT